MNCPVTVLEVYPGTGTVSKHHRAAVSRFQFKTLFLSTPNYGGNYRADCVEDTIHTTLRLTGGEERRRTHL